MKWLWALMRPYVEAAITHKIIVFHDDMVRIGQIPDVHEALKKLRIQ